MPEKRQPVESSWTQGENGAAIKAKIPEYITSLDELKAYCQWDESRWELVSWECKAYQMGSVDAEKNPRVTQLFSVSVKLKARAHHWLDGYISRLVQSVPLYRQPLPVIGGKREHLRVVGIVDHHLGKLAWGDETGSENYDVGIAERLYRSAIDRVVALPCWQWVQTAVLVAGNDFLHIDNASNTTTSGTQVDTDGRYIRTAGIARDLIIDAVVALRQVCPKVVIAVVPGNHDRQTMQLLGMVWQERFRGRDDVEVVSPSSDRLYYQYGSVGLCLAHGDGVKQKDRPGIFAYESPRLWGCTTHREVLLGHLHHTKVEDKHGVIVRTLPALCPPDVWHSRMGFVGADRSTRVLTYSKRSYISEHRIGIEDLVDSPASDRVVVLESS